MLYTPDLLRSQVPCVMVKTTTSCTRWSQTALSTSCVLETTNTSLPARFRSTTTKSSKRATLTKGAHAQVRDDFTEWPNHRS